MARNRVIGKGGKLSWHLLADLKRFKQFTMGHHIVMGRKTWESIGRLLPGREHVIITRQRDFSVPGAKVVGSLEAAIAAAGNDAEVFVIGGGEIYALALPIADRILLTEIDHDFDGDTFFPMLSETEWQETGRTSLKDEASGLTYSYVTLERTE
jgi:dihydrofolate reductase